MQDVPARRSVDGALSATHRAGAEAAVGLIERSSSAHTRRVYASALGQLAGWLDGRRLEDTSLAAYLGHLHQTGRAAATAAVVVAAVRRAARDVGEEPPAGPLTRQALEGFRRAAVADVPAGRGQARGLTAEECATVLATCLRPRRTGRGLERPETAERRGFVDAAIVIGANGAGKSTWCDRHQEDLPASFYNADSIARELGDWNSADKQREARELVDKAIEKHLKTRTDFGFESTYSGRSRPQIVRRAKAAGYGVAAVFIGTRRPEINIDRVKARVADGTGHDVPESEIRRRWTAAQENLVGTCEEIDDIKLIDNSSGGARRLARMTEDQRTTSAREVSSWAADLQRRIERQRGTTDATKDPNAR